MILKMSPGSTNAIPPIKDGHVQLDSMIEDICTTRADRKAAMAGRPNGATLLNTKRLMSGVQEEKLAYIAYNYCLYLIKDLFMWYH